MTKIETSAAQWRRILVTLENMNPSETSGTTKVEHNQEKMKGWIRCTV